VTNQVVYTCEILVSLVLICLVRFSCSNCPHWQHREFVANNYSPAQFGDDSGHFPDSIQEDRTAPILGGSDLVIFPKNFPMYFSTLELICILLFLGFRMIGALIEVHNIQ
jgi:hypothetical protein